MLHICVQTKAEAIILNVFVFNALKGLLHDLKKKLNFFKNHLSEVSCTIRLYKSFIIFPKKKKKAMKRAHSVCEVTNNINR